MKLIKLSVIALLALTLTACGDSENTEFNLGPFITGTFTSECFHNKPASSETDIYTVAVFTLNSDGTGSNYVRLYTENDCSGEAVFENTFSLTFSYIKNYNDVAIMKMIQDVDDEKQTLYISLTIQDGGYYADLDLTKNADCGPFEGIPTLEQTEFFAEAPETRGVRLAP